MVRLRPLSGSYQGNANPGASLSGKSETRALTARDSRCDAYQDLIRKIVNPGRWLPGIHALCCASESYQGKRQSRACPARDSLIREIVNPGRCAARLQPSNTQHPEKRLVDSIFKKPLKIYEGSVLYMAFSSSLRKFSRAPSCRCYFRENVENLRELPPVDGIFEKPLKICGSSVLYMAFSTGR